MAMTAQQCFMKQSCTSFPQSSRFVVSARVPSIRPWLRSPSPVPRSRPALNAASPTKGKKGLNIDRDGAPVVANDDKASIDSFDFDSVLQRDLIANGPRSTRRTKIICTIGPKSCSSEMLEMLAEAGMNCARLNMTHETHEWHAAVIQRIRELNQKRGYAPLAAGLENPLLSSPCLPHGGIVSGIEHLEPIFGQSRRANGSRTVALVVDVWFTGCICDGRSLFPSGTCSGVGLLSGRCGQRAMRASELGTDRGSPEEGGD
mmetsp:Transcript_40285/g.95724  ORF Transcript_40285/g.95724 Transcript_40285/m.95724 type:complete len:260 (-) Transcript_40285:1741-2520(-)